MLKSCHVNFSFSGTVVLEKNSKLPGPHFDIFVIISSLKRTWPLIWTNLNSLCPRIICTKFDWFWPAGSGEQTYKKKFQCVFTLLLSSPFGEGQSLSFEQTWISSFQGWFVPSLFKIGPVVLEKKIFEWPHPIFTFLWLSPLWRGPGPLFEQTWIPFTQG